MRDKERTEKEKREERALARQQEFTHTLPFWETTETRRKQREDEERKIRERMVEEARALTYLPYYGPEPPPPERRRREEPFEPSGQGPATRPRLDPEQDRAFQEAWREALGMPTAMPELTEEDELGFVPSAYREEEEDKEVERLIREAAEERRQEEEKEAAKEKERKERINKVAQMAKEIREIIQESHDKYDLEMYGRNLDPEDFFNTVLLGKSGPRTLIKQIDFCDIPLEVITEHIVFNTDSYGVIIAGLSRIFTTAIELGKKEYVDTHGIEPNLIKIRYGITFFTYGDRSPYFYFFNTQYTSTPNRSNTSIADRFITELAGHAHNKLNNFSVYLERVGRVDIPVYNLVLGRNVPDNTFVGCLSTASIFFTYREPVSRLPGTVVEEVKKVSILDDPYKGNFSTLKKVPKKIRKIVTFRDYLGLGVCGFENYISIITNRTDKLCNQYEIDRWRDLIAEKFFLLPQKQKEYITEGKLILFVKECFIENGENIIIYYYDSNRFIIPSQLYETRVLPIKEYDHILLVCSRHCYCTTLEMLYTNIFNKKFSSAVANIEELGTGKYGIINYINRNFNNEKVIRKKHYVMEPDYRAQKKEIRHIHYFLDIETYNRGNGYQDPYLIVIKEQYKDVIEGKHIFYGKNCCIDMILDFLIPLIVQSKKEKNVYRHIWAHNGSCFDYIILCRYLQRFFPIDIKGSKTKIKTIKISECIEMLDSCCWFGGSLRNLANDCNTIHRKTDFSFANISLDRIDRDLEFRKKSIEYCTNDCVVLEEVVQKLILNMFENFEYPIECEQKIQKSGPKIKIPKHFPCSASALAVYIYSHGFQDFPLHTNDKESIYNAERQAYHGGITLATRLYGRNIKSYDINSSYPYSMTCIMPYQYTHTTAYDNTKIIEPTDLYEVTSFDFPPHVKIPNLFVKSSKQGQGLIFVKHWSTADNEDGKSQYYWGCEILLAMKLGCEFEFGNVHHYTQGSIFKKYVDFFYKKKSEAKTAYEKLFYKRLLNSLYGKLGQKNEPNKICGDLFVCIQDLLAREKDIEFINILNNFSIDVKLKQNTKYYERIGGLVRFPSYIAAKSRCTLLEAVYAGDNEGKSLIDYICYMDTDSIFLCDGKTLNSSYVDNYKLGYFKLEVGKCYDRGLFFGAKSYFLFNTSKMAEGLSVFKGIREFSKTEENIDVLYKSFLDSTKHFTSRFEMFRRAFGEIQIMQSERRIKATFAFKRLILDDPPLSLPFQNIQQAAEKYMEYIKPALLEDSELKRLERSKMSQLEKEDEKAEKTYNKEIQSLVREFIRNINKENELEIRKLYGKFSLPEPRELSEKIVKIFSYIDNNKVKENLLNIQDQRTDLQKFLEINDIFN
jgi:hypothetical protein